MKNLQERTKMTQNAKKIRQEIIKASYRARSAHNGSNMSCADIFSALYFHILRLPPQTDFEKRDIFVLSKAHSALALYSTLYLKGLISKEIFESFYTNDGHLPGHLDRHSSPFVEVSAGSLGHGLAMALGMAYACKEKRVFCLMGDGECQEGSIWESAMLAPKLNAFNLIAIVDYNNLQGYGRARELVAFEPFAAKWQAFGWEAIEVDGHDEKAIINAINKHLKTAKKPLCLICHTIKGKGVSFMEDELCWHYYAIGDDEYKQALKELE